MAVPRRVTHTPTTVTPDLAQHWLSSYLFTKQRAVRRHHVKQLALAMLQGLFREGTTISFAVLNNVRYLINGQHTLHAIIASGRALRLSVEDHHVASFDEIADLYGSFDIHLRRTGSDIYAAYDFASQHDLSKPSVRALSAAIPIIIGGFLPATRSKDHPANLFMSNFQNRKQAMAQWAGPAAAYFDTFKGDISTRRQFQAQRANVAAVGIVTFRYRPAEAKEFWGRVARREHLSMAMPEYRLVNYLDDNAGMDMRDGFRYARGVAAAWNAAFTGRTLSRGIVPRHLPLPMLIAGTPFDGKHDLAYFKDGTLCWNPVEVNQKDVDA